MLGYMSYHCSRIVLASKAEHTGKGVQSRKTAHPVATKREGDRGRNDRQ